MNRNTLISGITFIVALVAFFSTVLFFNRKPALRGIPVNPPIAAAEFSMTAADGSDFSMSAQRGKVVLLLFGFVNCPEECPLTLAHFRQALELLGPDARDVRVVLVTTDPVRDTPQAMKNYLANFNPEFVGIPGDLEQIQKIWDEYGVEVMHGGESHSSYTYVIDRQGRQRVLFTPESLPEEIASDLKVLLAE